SCIWYSKLIALELGVEKMQDYLLAFSYGNCDLSGGLPLPGPSTPAWVASSLKISPREQIHFIKRMLLAELPLSEKASLMTQKILFKEELPGGWKLFGKTGWSGSVNKDDPFLLQWGWFVGCIEKQGRFFPFAYLIRADKIDLDRRISRTKELLLQSQVMR
ncbi:MAG: class D beta-lactamase, partial [Chlamydiales bacterium]|nr:class D beta-lactamase [Chlamydiales bacterium]